MSSSFTTKPLISCHGQLLNFQSICSSLEQVGIKSGDDICVHTSIMRLGRNLVSKEQLLGTLVAALREVIGPTGTLLMPTFTYSYCHQQVYDVRNTPSTMGTLTEYYRKLPECQRTLDPIFSFAISGCHTDFYLHENMSSCFGPNCVYDLLTQRDGKIVIFGDKRTGYTYLHYTEEKEKVDYRFHKTFSGITINATGQEQQTSIDYFVRYLDRPSVFTGFVEVLEKHHAIKETCLGGGELCAFSCRDFDRIFTDLIRHDVHRYLIQL